MVYSTCYGQTTSSDLAKVRQLLGDEFLELKPFMKYPYSSLGAGVEVDTSRTIVGDTTGAHYRNEYVLFRSYISTESVKEKMKLMKSDLVSIEEFQKFQEYVRDSIAREKIHYGLEDDVESSRYINYRKEYFNQESGEWQIFDPSEREQNRRNFPLNWDQKFKYDDPRLVPILADMYLPPSERFYKNRIFDSRKFIYHYYELETRDALKIDCKERMYSISRSIRVCRDQFKFIIDKRVNVLNDDYEWAKKSQNNFDEFSSLAQTYSTLFPSEPVTGILGSQARAFCYWKQERLQEEFDRKGLPYRVLVTLPTKEDIDATSNEVGELVVPETDYTERWKITCDEYAEFVKWVSDSIKREFIYRNIQEDSKAEKMLSKSKDYRFDEGRLDYLEFDPADREMNRMLYPFNYKVNIDRKSWKEILDKNNFNVDKPFYRYYFVDAMGRSFDGYFDETYDSVDPPSTDHHYEYYEVDHYRLVDSITGEKIFTPGKGYWFWSVDKNIHDPGVRSHESFHWFIKEQNTSVLPIDRSELELKGELIQSIFYDQAIAFYRWKYPIQKLNKKSDWKDFVLPTEAQFEAIKRGEKVVVQEHTLEYPTPGFRYVVHVFK